MLTPRQEKKLVRLLRKRDEAAFRKMVSLFQHKVYNLCYRMLGNEQEAEDMAQEVFVTVFRSIDSFRGDSKFSTWLYRIATNHTKNRIKYLARRKNRQKQPLDDIEEHTLGQPIGGERMSRPDRQAMGHELESVLQRAIAELDEEHRTLIVLREIENLSYQEIGEITKLASGTVKSRLHRARLQLKDIVERYLAGEPTAAAPETSSSSSSTSTPNTHTFKRTSAAPAAPVLAFAGNRGSG